MVQRRRTPKADASVADYRYDATRKNNPPAGLAAQGRVQEQPRHHLSYDPHLPPTLRFDPTGEEDGLPALLEDATRRPLTAEEAQQLADALRHRQPWLEWAGKREAAATGLSVDPVALHIHERISAQALLKIAARQPVQRSFFADPELEYWEAVKFYQHDVDWSNRLILGDSLQVMASLAYREDLAGKVQMIYIDPPYGIKFASNFQPQVGQRDVKDRSQDLTREAEMVKAYRDTWTLGVHSYLAYLRDRLISARELLADSGSLFLQISDENLHRVRSALDEVMGQHNFCGLITFQKTGGIAGELIQSTVDYLIWYAKKRSQVKFRRLYQERTAGDTSLDRYDRVQTENGAEFNARTKDREGSLIEGRPLQMTSLFSDGQTASGNPDFFFRGKRFACLPGSHWKTNIDGLSRLARADRIGVTGNGVRYRRFADDFPVIPITDRWESTQIGTERIYVVQTAQTVIQRCMLMTTDPGDLVLDPTSGSGTTAYVAEQWGRRWIAIDTSRVANAIARQRIVTAAFPMYRTRGEDEHNPSAGFVYKTVPHITLKSIAQNAALDPIFARHQAILDGRLAALNDALRSVTPDLRQRLAAKLALKERGEGKRAVTDADRRRWLLPKDAWQEWEVPFDTDEDWPTPLQRALQGYRAAWRAKMDEVNAAIAASAEHEELVDQPEIVRGVTRVAGPFTVEAVMPAEASLDDATPIGGAPDEDLDTFDGPTQDGASVAANADAYLDRMIALLRQDGVRFPNNRHLTFSRLDPLATGDVIHAEGEWTSDDDQPHLVAISFGPEHGPVTAPQVEQALRLAYRRGYDDLVFAGFSFDAAAQAAIQEDPNPRVRCHLAHIRPDVNMGPLLKDTPSSQLFTVFGLPRTELRQERDGYVIEMQGVDIYDPLANAIHPTTAEKVAAWFVDTDYDGQTFCVTQAFFPDRDAWKKLSAALKGLLTEDHFAQFAGTTSLPFPAGKHQRAAVKVIDPRGNEVMRVHQLNGAFRYAD